ncbi:MAG: hypothetical protein GY801_37850, partial [bacterium]|nr:hypothetical protein [bacterium]
RYGDRFGEGGFRFLLEQGTVYTNAHYQYANTETIVGHATLATGAFPSEHGMTGNVWFDREAGELSYNIEDPDHPLLPTREIQTEGEQVDPAQKLSRPRGARQESCLPRPSVMDWRPITAAVPKSSACRARIAATYINIRIPMTRGKKYIASHWFQFRHVLGLFLILLCCLGIIRNGFSEESQTDASDREHNIERGEQEDTSATEKGDSEEGTHTEETEADKNSETQDENWADKGQETISQTVSGLARRFDSFFGDSETAEERDFTHGRIELGVWWDQKDEFDVPTDFRVNFNLPNFEHRLNAFVGRTSDEEMITGAASGFEGLPSIFQDLAEDNDEWLVGFGYSPVRDKHNRFDLDAGVNISSSKFEPFAKIRYRSNLFIGDKSLLRLRPTLYWKSEDGFGTSLRVDIDHVFNPDFLIRWASSGHYSETTEGVEWWSNLNLFQHLGTEKGLMYTVGLSGETETPVEIKDYGAGLLYRQQLFRKWLSGFVGGSVKWPQDEPEDEREAVLGLGAGIEVRFGQRPKDFEGR